MKAVVCEAYGPPESVVVKELPSPEAGAGELKQGVLSFKMAARRPQKALEKCFLAAPGTN